MAERVPSMTDALVSVFQKNREAAAPQPETPAEPEGEKAQAVSFKAVGVNEFGVIVGIGAAAGSPDKLDLDGEYLDNHTICKAAFDFTASPDRTFLRNHDPACPIDAELVESWVGAPLIKEKGAIRALKAGESLSDGSEVVGISLDKENLSHWWVGLRVKDPEIFEAAKAGKIAGWSWGGAVNKSSV